MFKGKFFRISVLVVVAGLVGVWTILATFMITRDGVYWVGCARRISSPERVSGTSGTSGQKYLFRPEGQGGSGLSGNSGMGISVGTNGVFVYEHDTGYVPALAVYQGNLGTDWNQITVTYTHKQPKIYVNGILVRTGLTSPKKSVFAPKQLGGRNWGYFKGAVKSVCIWNRSLSDAEVMAGASGDVSDVGLVGKWMFDEGKGTTVRDNSGNNGHAVIRGATWKAYGEGYVLEFDGIDDTVQLNYKPPHDNFTVSARVQAAAACQISSIVTRLSKIQDPGLPLMIACWHRLLSGFGLGNGNMDWATAGQTLGLLCRIFSLVPLYYIGKLLVGERHAFWAVLILIFLPWPAEWGHDALREWPHLLFLSGGLLMVLLAFTYRRMIFFLPAGLLAGLGHTIRPECTQVVIYALFGLMFIVIHPNALMTRKKAVLGALALLVSFSVIFIPYMQMRGEILPVKLKEILATGNAAVVSVAPVAAYNTTEMQRADFLPASVEGVIDLVQNLSENLFYYFFPFMLVGLYVFFGGPKKKSFNRGFIAGFIVLNFLMYTALYHHWGYINRRHLLPLTAIVIFFVPLGIETVAGLLSQKKTDIGTFIDSKKQTTVFLGLIVVGILVCLPKLAEPMGKSGFRKAADYLRQNTPPDAIVAVPDKRITFYAQREGLEYAKQIPAQADYVVKVIKDGDGMQEGEGNISEVYSTWADKNESSELVIYKVIR